MTYKGKRLEVLECSVVIRDNYRFGTMEIQLPNYEADIKLVLPNGEHITLQYRLEGPSIDVCMPWDTSVTNWKGDDMEDAPPLTEDKAHAHIRMAKQLVIDLPEKTVDLE